MPPKMVRVLKTTLPAKPPPEIQTDAEFEEWVCERAHYFTCVWKVRPGEVAGRENEYPTLKAAILAGIAVDRNFMIYAVYELNRETRDARSAMLGNDRSNFDKYLLLRKEGLLRRLPKGKRK